MKKLYFLFSLWPFFVIGQVSSDFENGLGSGWEQFPLDRWESSTEQALSGLFSLHHSFDNSESGKDRISCKPGSFDTNHEISWEFILRYGYSTSSTNKWQIALATDKSATGLAGSDFLNAYLFGVNITGSDDSLRLFTIREGQLSRLCNTSLNFEKDIGSAIFHCLIKRDSSGFWTIYSAKENDNLYLIGSAREYGNSLPGLNHFVISCQYSSTKDRLLWFDNLTINTKINLDTVPPAITGIKITGPKNITLELSEETDTLGFQNNRVTLIPGNKNPAYIQFFGNKVSCLFDEAFINRTEYRLLVNDLKDKEGNISPPDSISFIYYKAEKNDLVVTEIMADPSPAVYLPETEYIEFFNRCPYPVYLDSFILQTGKKELLLPDIILDSERYLVLSEIVIADSIGLQLFPSSSVITNDGQQIFLRDKNGTTISSAEFNIDWYRDEFKSQGGWSLEKIDPDKLCDGKENWKASEDESGGTPGRFNSVKASNLDLTIPFVERIEFADNNKIRLLFSEYVDPGSFPNVQQFSIIPGNIHPDSLVFPENFCDAAEIKFSEEFQTGTTYQLTIPPGIQDCAGNMLINNEPISFGLPSPSGLTDLVISEILYEPLPGCPEYIELYNLSAHLLDLSDIRITVASKDEAGTPSIPINIPVLFFPGEYLVLCKNKEALLSCHEINNPAKILEVMDLPSFPDTESCIRLFNRSLEPVDIFCYKPEDGFPMLNDSHGVSLERLRLDRKTGDLSEWHSASSVSGFGTPGAENSQALTDMDSQNSFVVFPEIFTPDNDGKNDILEINYSVEKEGFVGTLAVFDPSGRTMCFLAENEILGTSGIFVWDGRNDIGNICKTGLYLLYFEMWNLKGEKERFKKTVVLVRR